MDIRTIIVEKHGSNCILALAGEAEDIIREHQELLDGGKYGSENPIVALYFGGSAEEAAAQEAYNRIRDKVIHNWLSAIPRQQMLATLNTMGAVMGGATIEPLPGEPLSPTLLAQLWNKANKEESPISINQDYL